VVRGGEIKNRKKFTVKILSHKKIVFHIDWVVVLEAIEHSR
jgi:hypothetical protein